MSQVNLLPPDIVQAQALSPAHVGRDRRGRHRRSLLVFGFYLLQNGKLGDVNDEIEAQNATNASIQAGIAEKQKFADLQAEAQASSSC